MTFIDATLVRSQVEYDEARKSRFWGPSGLPLGTTTGIEAFSEIVSDKSSVGTDGLAPAARRLSASHSGRNQDGSGMEGMGEYSTVSQVRKLGKTIQEAEVLAWLLSVGDGRFETWD